MFKRDQLKIVKSAGLKCLNNCTLRNGNFLVKKNCTKDKNDASGHNYRIVNVYGNVHVFYHL